MVTAWMIHAERTAGAVLIMTVHSLVRQALWEMEDSVSALNAQQYSHIVRYTLQLFT